MTGQILESSLKDIQIWGISNKAITINARPSLKRKCELINFNTTRIENTKILRARLAAIYEEKEAARRVKVRQNKDKIMDDKILLGDIPLIN